jgi:uncharacterized protein
MSEDTQFYNETLKKYLSLDEVIGELIEYVNNKPGARYKITVGTDSAGTNNTQFVTAIAILRVGSGGRYFWTKSEKFFCPTLQDRIYKETMHSITFAQELKSRLKEKLGDESFWPARIATQSVAGGDDKITVHLDVGRKGPTKELIETVVGMVKGFGLEAVIKPDSFCAFVLADRHT